MSFIQNFFQTSDLFFEITSNKENLDLKTEIGDTLYNAGYRKRVIIPSSVTVGSATTTNAALKVPSGLGGQLYIDNYGSIQGAGGPAGSNGGDAILAQSNCTIENKPTGTIYAGGGGGGGGGTGGAGGPGSYDYVTGSYPYCVAYTTVFRPARQGGPYVACAQFGTGYYYATQPTTGGAGGAGGSGGVGKGYGQSPTAGSAGVAGVAGGTNAGTGGNGGTGGTGGDWGQSGTSGSTGSTGTNGNVGAGLAGAAGIAGGLAGYYVNGLSTYVTLSNNGTVAGRTN